MWLFRIAELFPMWICMSAHNHAFEKSRGLANGNESNPSLALEESFHSCAWRMARSHTWRFIYPPAAFEILLEQFEGPPRLSDLRSGQKMALIYCSSTFHQSRPSIYPIWIVRSRFEYWVDCRLYGDGALLADLKSMFITKATLGSDWKDPNKNWLTVWKLIPY